MRREKMKKKKSIWKRIVLGVLLVMLALLAGLICQQQRQARAFRKQFREAMEKEPAEYNNIEEALENGGEVKKEFELDTYIDNRDVTKRIYIYDMDYIEEALSFEEKSLDDFLQVIQENDKIIDKFKPLVEQYCQDLFEKYPDVEKRQFYRNLQYLEIIECTEEELFKVSWNLDSRGCYVRTEDKIYVLKDKEYEKGTWDYQVIYHELSHCLRDIIYEDENGIRVSIQFMGLNYYDIPNAEALNSLFAVSLFDYEERDIAYQLQSNTHQLILSCMDNYSLSDYVNHSMTYYAQQLDAYNHDDNYATTILSLMNEQYEDFHDDQREEPQSTYYPIYDYVTKMYLGKNLTPEMSQEEAKAVMDDFMEKLLFDVPEDYHIDTDHFYEYFEEYYQNEIQTGQVENV